MRNLKLFLFLAIVLLSCRKEEVPTVITAEISNILGTTATCGGTITNEGSSTVLTKGVCWSTGTTPTIENSKTVEGAGAGSFTSNISGLNGATTYYIRAYATNEAGTGYGMTMSFKTLGSKPSIIEALVLSTTDKTAKVSLKVNANHLLTTVVFEYGLGNFSLQSSPIIINGNIDSEVTTDLISLTSASKYLFRIKAQNSAGISYSNEGYFYTIGNFTDIDNNRYPTVKIGNQLWMAENLRVTRFRNGDHIPNITENANWCATNYGAYCFYNNEAELYKNSFGALYNFYAVSDNRGLCPVGWHPPSDIEWKSLEIFLGMSQSEADKVAWRGINQGTQLKASSTSIIPWNGTNSSGFNAIAGGYREANNGEMYSLGSLPGGIASFWTSDASGSTKAYMRYLATNYHESFRAEYFKTAGYSVRCLKD